MTGVLLRKFNENITLKDILPVLDVGANCKKWPAKPHELPRLSGLRSGLTIQLLFPPFSEKP